MFIQVQERYLDEYYNYGQIGLQRRWSYRYLTINTKAINYVREESNESFTHPLAGIASVRRPDHKDLEEFQELDYAELEHEHFHIHLNNGKEFIVKKQQDTSFPDSVVSY